MRELSRMMKTIFGIAAGVVAIGLTAGASAQEHATPELLERDWHFQGVFGTFDRAAAQRGLQVYREVCSTCHALDYVSFRTLEDLGFTEDEVSAIAAEYTVMDGPNDSGEMFERPGRASDYFPPPFPNEEAARASNGGAYPPNLSLITKARADGPSYVYSLLHGYEDPPEGEPEREGLYYNKYFPGHWIAMAAPLYPDGVSYSDGTPASIDQMAYDLVNFLEWTAEPKLEERKETGVKAILFLVVLTALLYLTKRKVWSAVQH